MTEYIDIAELPAIPIRGRWMNQVTEWKKIPPDKMLEIPVSQDEKAHSLQAAIMYTLGRHLPHLRVAVRAGRLFIVNEAKP